MKRVAGAILVGLAVAGCGGEAGRRGEVSPYVVQVDLAPQIQSFGEETATADEAGEQLAAMGTAAIPALATALGREPAKDVRLKAIEVLRAIGTPDAVPPLLSAAGTDADEDVRADALRALGAIGDGRALALMEKALADQHLPIRAGGVMGCATLCTSPAAIERLATSPSTTRTRRSRCRLARPWRRSGRRGLRRIRRYVPPSNTSLPP